MKMSESIANISKALASFQKEVKQPVKDGTNPHFKSKYVTLDDTVKAIHECSTQHGLSYTQMPITNEQGVGVITLIMHESGEFIQFEPFVLPMEKKTAQGAGSGITYARRYSLSAAFGIVSDLDDDGNEATANAPESISQKQVGLIKVNCKSIASLKDVVDVDVLKSALGNNAATYETLTTLSKEQATKLLDKLDKWRVQAEQKEPVVN